eukprot:1360-Lingulodinium_polyedra.AAC.1
MARPAGVACRDIFPLPPLQRPPARGGGPAGGGLPCAAVCLCDVWLAAINYLHGTQWTRVCRTQPTAAQLR